MKDVEREKKSTLHRSKWQIWLFKNRFFENALGKIMNNKMKMLIGWLTKGDEILYNG